VENDERLTRPGTSMRRLSGGSEGSGVIDPGRHGLGERGCFPFRRERLARLPLRYTQLLERAGDALRLRYTVGERGRANLSFRHRSQRGDFAAYSANPPHHDRPTWRPAEITVDADGGSDIELFLPLRQGIREPARSPTRRRRRWISDAAPLACDDRRRASSAPGPLPGS
jgi:hypothetical protein